MSKYVWAWTDTEDVYINSCNSLAEILFAVLENEFAEVQISTIQNKFLINVSSSNQDEKSAQLTIEQDPFSVAEFLNNITTVDDRYNRFDIRTLEINISID